ncbi:hypothetical protein CIRG_05707 [Coccidioides immitis RMSCC 2394]|uniref:Uncharacterized protein n=1 Tax=Coccidioides immitis RMSCC 2394 TaxID=404692 RepID=A0A0J7B7W1_COCIT|nr:hypothetical protein CIRG_05707 [Coccidioides immitis RMSCC 2394]
MEMLPQLEPRLLIQMSSAELLSYYRTITENWAIENQQRIVAHIIAQIHSGAIPPTIFNVWLPLMLHRSPPLLKSLLLDPKSYCIRNIGLKSLCRTLRKRRWRKRAWDAVGGAAGLFEIFQAVGSSQARMLAKMIGKRMRKKPAFEEDIDMLTQALTFNCSVLGDRVTATRRLAPDDVSPLLQACSESFLLQLFMRPYDPDFPLFNWLDLLGEPRTDLLRRISVGATPVDTSVRQEIVNRLPKNLFSSNEPYSIRSTSDFQISESAPPGLRFCLDLVDCLRSQPISLSNSTVFGWALTAITAAADKKASFDDILRLIQTVTDFASDRNEGLGQSLHAFPAHLAQLWAFADEAAGDLDTSIIIFGRRRTRSHPSRPNAKHKQSLENLLVRFIQVIPQDNLTPLDIASTFLTLEKKVDGSAFPLGSKLGVIKLLSLHSPGVQIDLDALPASEKDWRRFRWGINVFNTLPAKDARWLFSQIESLGLVDDTILFSASDSSKPTWYNKGLLKVKWAAADPVPGNDGSTTFQFIEEIKAEAETQRESDVRRDWAMRAIEAACESKSIPLFKEVSRWTSRYLRDPLVYRYLVDSLFGSESADLLSCTKLPHRPTSLTALAELVQEANAVLSYHVNVALSALQEPSFKNHPLRNPSTQLTEVVSMRIDGVNQFSKLGLADKDSLVEVLLDSMIPVLLLYETIAVTEGNEMLHWHAMGGPLDDLNCPTPTPGYALRFLDKLALQRDELWAKQRRIRQPQSAALKLGWPKGLPVQALLPSIDWASAVFKDKSAAPFVAKRLDEILFCNSKTVLSPIPRSTRGIGGFVDSLPYVITAFCACKSEVEQSERIIQVWEHYTRIFPAQSKYTRHIKQYLLQNYACAKPRPRKAVQILDPLILGALPGLENSTASEPSEWNPYPAILDASSDIEMDDEGPATLLECRLSTYWFFHITNDFYATFEEPSTDIEEPKPCALDIWQPKCNFCELSLVDKEIIIVSAMLFLDTLGGESSGIFSTSFPENSGSPRYPPLYLDYDFLSSIENESEAVTAALSILNKLRHMIPAELLCKLSASLLKKLPQVKSKLWLVERAAFDLIKLVGKADQPELAVDLSLHVIEHMPGASSWHRDVVSLGLIQRLDFAVAERMLAKFASVVLEFLARTPENDLVEEEDLDDAILCDEIEHLVAPSDTELGKKPEHIKISTIKLLARLIGDGGFFSSKTALHTLQSLFHASHHIDVRDAVITALFQLLRKSMGLDGNLSDEVYGIVTSFYTAAAAPSERITLSEADWDNADKGGPLPSVNENRPLLQLFIERARHSIPHNLREDYVKNTILPLLAESTRKHNRWIRMFLKKVGLSEESIPISNFGPFDNEVENKVFVNWLPYLQKDYLLLHRAWALRYMDCCKVTFVEEKLTAQNPNWKYTDSGGHWSRFMENYSTCKVFNAGQIAPKVGDGITQDDLANEVYQRCQIVLHNPIHIGNDRKAHLSLAPIRALIHNLFSSLQNSVSRELAARQVLAGIAAEVDRLRTQSWLGDPNRHPAILPSCMEIQALLLPFPHLEESSQDRYDTFAGRVFELTSNCTLSSSFIDDFRHLEKAMAKVRTKDKLACALRLGRLSGDACGELVQNLRIQLAAELLDRLNVVAVAQSEEAKFMVQAWTGSSNEWVRTTAWQLNERFGYRNPAASASVRG